MTIESTQSPCVVVAAAVSVLDRPYVRLGPYQNFALVAEEPLGRVGRWSHAMVFGVQLEFPL